MSVTGLRVGPGEMSANTGVCRFILRRMMILPMGERDLFQLRGKQMGEDRDLHDGEKRREYWLLSRVNDFYAFC